MVLCALLLLAACSGGDGDERDAGAPAATTRPLPASLAAANGWLAYQSVNPRGGDGVFLVRANGSDDHEILTDLQSQHLHPDFSRDGKRLAYDSEANVYVAGADGTAPRLIANCDPNAGCMQHWEPAWSPDGKQLAISTAAGMGDPPKRFGIGMIDLATQTVRPVVDHASRAGQDHFPRCGRPTGAGWCSGAAANTRAACRRRSSWSTPTGPAYASSPHGSCWAMTLTGHPTAR
jgi:hypothetical protein